MGASLKPLRGNLPIAPRWRAVACQGARLTDGTKRGVSPVLRHGGRKSCHCRGQVTRADAPAVHSVLAEEGGEERVPASPRKTVNNHRLRALSALLELSRLGRCPSGAGYASSLPRPRSEAGTVLFWTPQEENLRWAGFFLDRSLRQFAGSELGEQASRRVFLSVRIRPLSTGGEGAKG